MTEIVKRIKMSAMLRTSAGADPGAVQIARIAATITDTAASAYIE
jgi:hypothetical protein